MLVQNVELFWLQSIVKLHPAAFRIVYPMRIVNNIYFDTLNFDAFREGVDGLAFRTKTRIRWYGNLEGRVEPVLQKKRRENLDALKNEFPLDTLSIDSKKTWKEVLKKIANSMGTRYYTQMTGLLPTLINQYRREYLLSSCSRFRLTIDSNLKYFDQCASPYININRSLTDHPYFIIELKYDPVHDTIAHDVASWFPFRLTRSSKYKTGLSGGIPI